MEAHYVFVPLAHCSLVRFYIQVSQLHGNTDRHSITSEMILKTAQTIIAPYKLDIAPKDLNWWTAYQIGQRTSTRFFKHDRVFIAGDACHTHSPKAGELMVDCGYSFGKAHATVCHLSNRF